MARINIEEKWWTDPRRFILAELVGSEELADGVMVRAWRLAQDFWKQGKKPVPKVVFMKISHAESILKACLAEQKKSSIYVIGSSKCFSWLISAKNDGKRGGDAKSRNQREKILPSAYPLPTLSLPSSSPSSSSSSSSSKNKEKYISEGLKICLEEYQRTLDHFKIKRDAKSGEYKLASLGSRFGFEDLTRAIAGMRRERKTESFDPAECFSLDRLAEKFEKFLNLGAQAYEQQHTSVDASKRFDREDSDSPSISSSGASGCLPAELQRILRGSEAS